MRKKNSNRATLYVVLMVLFAVLSYVLIDRGINSKTKILVDYQESSDINYRVYLLENDIYNQEYLKMGENYISKMIDYIDFEISYNNLFSRDINGYYSYGVDTTLVAYTSEDDVLWEKNYEVLSDKVMILDKSNVRNIDIYDTVKIDYLGYRNELEKFSKDYGIEVSGYLLIKFRIDLMLDFKGLDETIMDEKLIEVMIPLSLDTFKINPVSNYNGIDSYDEYSSRLYMNILLSILGLLCLSISLALLVVVIRELMIISSRESKYVKELRKILNKYGDIIINVNKFYNKKKYNLIYVDSFQELLDVYDKVGMPISFKEVKRKAEAIFLIIDDDNAWIYKMEAKNEDN